MKSRLPTLDIHGYGQIPEGVSRRAGTVAPCGFKKQVNSFVKRSILAKIAYLKLFLKV